MYFIDKIVKKAIFLFLLIVILSAPKVFAERQLTIDTANEIDWGHGVSYATVADSNYVYFATGRTVVIYNKSNLAKVDDIVLPNLVKDVEIDSANNLLHVSVYSEGVYVYDVSTVNFTLVDDFDSGDNNINQIFIDGNYVYLAMADYGINIFEKAVDNTFSSVGTFETAGSADSVYVQNSVCYVSDGTSGIYLLDVSDPTSPSQLGTYDTSGTAYGINVSADDNTAYVADGSYGLIILDISNPASISQLGTYNTSGTASDVYVDYPYVFIADAADLKGFNVTNPASPTYISRVSGALGASRIFADTNTLYISGGASGFSSVDITTRTSPTLTQNSGSASISIRAKKYGEYLFVANYAAGAKILNIVDNEFVKVSEMSITGVEGLDVDLANNLLFLAATPSGVKIYDISNIASPSLLATFPVVVDGDRTYDVVVDGDYLYTANKFGGLNILDISNPASPSLVGSLDTPTWGNGIDKEGNYVFLADRGGGVRVIDVSNVASPSEVGTFVPGGASIRDVIVDGNYIYTANHVSGMNIVDVSTPSSPSQTGIYNTAGLSYNVDFIANYIFIADESNGLVVVDATNKASPSLNYTFDTPNLSGSSAYGVLGVSHDDDNIYLANADLGVIALPYTIYFVAPTTAPDLDSGSDTGSSNSDEITDDSTPTFSGTCTTDETVNLYDGATLIGTTTCASSAYSITSSSLSTGAHNITSTFTDGVYESENSPILSITVVTVPGAPATLSTSAGDGQVALTWTVPTSNGGSAITDYLVEYRTTGSVPFTTFVDGVSTNLSTTVTGLTNGQSYDFQVSAINEMGTGTAFSPAASATPVAPSSGSTSSGPYVLWRNIPATVVLPEIIPIEEVKFNIPEDFKPYVCQRYMKSFIKVGQNNNTEEVKKLQQFLNKYEAENLLITGVYDSASINAVKRFQKKYKDQILSPWNLNNPTGNVLTTTTAKINMMSCMNDNLEKNVTCPYFKEYLKPGDVSYEIVRLQDFLNLINNPISDYSAENFSLSKNFNPQTTNTLKEFQKRYSKIVLRPWGLTNPTGTFYKTTRLVVNKLMNCSEEQMTLENGVIVR